MSVPKQNQLQCHFCEKTQKELAQLIAGPGGIHICNECIGFCVEILLEADAPPSIGADYQIISKTTLAAFEEASSSADTSDIVTFHPVFNRNKFEVQRDSCFYLGPFQDPFNAIYKDHVVSTLARQGFSVQRADEIFSTGPIVDDIWEGINTAEFLIADLTGKNPNVMYEVGMAHTVGKRVLLLSQSVHDIPFDLRHWRCLIYEYTPPGCKKLEDGISEAIRFFRQKRP